MPLNYLQIMPFHERPEAGVTIFTLQPYNHSSPQGFERIYKICKRRLSRGEILPNRHSSIRRSRDKLQTSLTPLGFIVQNEISFRKSPPVSS